MTLPKTLLSGLPLLLSATPLLAGGNAAPSSHFVFDDNFEGDIIINEVRVPAAGEATYTYYEALGWRGKGAGYAGIQAHPRGHNYIFSIWDHKEHGAPIKAVHTGPGTLIQKFGGEGTGLKSWNFELGWDTDVWYTLVSRCWPVGDHTFYGFWARSSKTGGWTHLVTMDVAAKDAYFKGGTDAFIEDWLQTGKNARTTHLRGGWKRKPDGAWHAFGGGRYSVNRWDLVEGKRSSNFKTNWNGGVGEDTTGAFYFMTAGGADTKPATANPSKHAIERAEKKPVYKPIAIRSGRARLGPGGMVKVSWETDVDRLPPFATTVTIHDDEKGEGGPLAEMKAGAPHLRGAELEVHLSATAKPMFAHIRCRDILDNDSPPLVIRVAKHPIQREELLPKRD